MPDHSEAKRYRKLAKQVRREAAVVSFKADKRRLEQLAEHYDRLADAAERAK